MNVKELIKKLKTYDQDLEIAVETNRDLGGGCIRLDWVNIVDASLDNCGLTGDFIALKLED